MEEISLSKFELGEIAKICGARIQSFKSSDMWQALVEQKCDVSFREIIAFVKASQRPGITPFLNKITTLVTSEVQKNPAYQAFDANICQQEHQTIQLELKLHEQISVVTNIESSGDLGQRYLSCDMINANFSCLKKLLSIDPTLTWPDYLKGLLPVDRRSESRRNVKDGTSGMVCAIPECIYTSKYVRVHVLSKLSHLQRVWELEALKLAKWISAAGVPVTMCMKGDEVIVRLQDATTLNELKHCLEAYPPIKLFRVRGYTLVKVPELTSQNMAKLYDDGTFDLVNVPAKLYSQAVAAVQKLQDKYIQQLLFISDYFFGTNSSTIATIGAIRYRRF